jgi:hypothetical protein
MTTIAAIRTPSSILMGGDSAQNTDGFITLVATPKVFFNGDYLFGVAGIPRLAEVLKYEFKPPRKIKGMGWDEFLARSFVPKLKTALGADVGLIEKSTILVGTKGGGIFEVDHSWYAPQSLEQYAAMVPARTIRLGRCIPPVATHGGDC